MTPNDATESAVQQIARQGMKDAPAWAQSLFDLIVAVDTDWNRAHAKNVDALDAHLVDAAKLTAAVADLDHWREDAGENCAERVRALICAEHDERHGAHMAEHHVPKPRRASDPGDADFTPDRDRAAGELPYETRVLWSWAMAVRGFALAVIITVVNIVVNLLWFGNP